MKDRKIYVRLILLLFVIFALVACGGTSQQTPSDVEEVSSTVEEVEVSEDVSEEETAVEEARSTLLTNLSAPLRRRWEDNG